MRTLLSAVILLLLPIAAWAAECGCGYPTRCAVPCERCRPRHVCVQVPVPQPQPCEYPEPMYDRGGFAAPPRMGTAAGESETTGFTGGGIQFPALHLKLPTIQLPGIVRFRRDAHMLLDQAEAPFGLDQRREYSFDAGPEIDGTLERAAEAPEDRSAPRSQPQPCPPPAAPNCADAEIQRLRQCEQMLQQRVRELEARCQGCESGTCPLPPARQPAAPAPPQRYQEQRGGPYQRPASPTSRPVEDLPPAVYHPIAPQGAYSGGPGAADPRPTDRESLERRAAAIEQQLVALTQNLEELYQARRAAAADRQGGSQIRFTESASHAASAPAGQRASVAMPTAYDQPMPGARTYAEAPLPNHRHAAFTLPPENRAPAPVERPRNQLINEGTGRPSSSPRITGVRPLPEPVR